MTVMLWRSPQPQRDHHFQAVCGGFNEPSNTLWNHLNQVHVNVNSPPVSFTRGRAGFHSGVPVIRFAPVHSSHRLETIKIEQNRSRHVYDVGNETFAPAAFSES